MEIFENLIGYWKLQVLEYIWAEIQYIFYRKKNINFSLFLLILSRLKPDGHILHSLHQSSLKLERKE